MKRIPLAVAATLLAASAFAQSTVTNSTGIGVHSGTGVPVTPGVPTASVTAVPAATPMVPGQALLPGGAMVQHSSTTILGGPSGDVLGTKTQINTYWANVPADVQRDASFQRWQRLK